MALNIIYTFIYYKRVICVLSGVFTTIENDIIILLCLYTVFETCSAHHYEISLKKYIKHKIRKSTYF